MGWFSKAQQSLAPRDTSMDDRLWALENPEPPKPVRVPDKTRLTVVLDNKDELSIELEGYTYDGGSRYANWEYNKLAREGRVSLTNYAYHYAYHSTSYGDDPSSLKARRMVTLWRDEGFVRIGQRAINLAFVREVRIEPVEVQ